jgi:hypothetical protein
MPASASGLERQDHDNVIAIHGVRCRLPSGWEVVGTYGGWRTGHLLVAEGRTARLSLSWARHAASPDLGRTLRTAGRRIDRDHVTGVMVAQEAIADGGLIGTWDGPHGTFHAAVRHLPSAGVTIIVRQLASGPAAPLRQLMTSVQGFTAAQGSPWRLYGLAVDLPAWWRLEGLQQLAGLVRGVWFRYPDGAMRADQVLVVRRFACASRLLEGASLGAWVRAGVHRRERILTEQEVDGVVQVSTALPASNWWRRLRGQSDRRELYAWTVAAGDRLVLQEWKGACDPLPCLRDG